jgi:thiol-disulfide isomerase/thioredoxin
MDSDSSKSEVRLNTAPQTIAECLEDLERYRKARWQALRESGQVMTQERVDEIQTQTVERAASHASGFAISQVRGTDLLVLARLYTIANQPEQAEAAVAARVADQHLTATERAEALLVALDRALQNPTDEKLPRAERIAAELGAIGTVQQVISHSRLAGAYDSLGLGEAALKHRRSVIELYQKLNSPEQTSEQVRGALASAVRYMDTGTEPFSSQCKELLQQAAALFPNDPNLAIEKTLRVFSLVGQLAPAIEAPYWLNGSPDGGMITFGLKPTLIQFTAHWCGPCRQTYPAMLELHKRFQQRGLEIVILTQLFGKFGQEANLPDEKEVEADRKYFAEEHGLPFRVAIGKPDARPDNRSRSAERNQQNYFVNVYPTFVVIDANGRIVRVKMGGGGDLETTLATEIEPLLLPRDGVTARRAP